SAFAAWLADAEAAGLAAAQQAFHVLDRSPGGRFHEGEVEAAYVRVRLGERVEYAVVRLDLGFAVALHRGGLVAQRIELLGEPRGDGGFVRAVDAAGRGVAQLLPDRRQQCLHAGLAGAGVQVFEDAGGDQSVVARKQFAARRQQQVASLRPSTGGLRRAALDVARGDQRGKVLP